jgi:hypothetical protein
VQKALSSPYSQLLITSHHCHISRLFRFPTLPRISPVQDYTLAIWSSMDDQSRWQETEEIYSILLTRGEDLKWRASLESRNLQHMYLAKGFSLSFQDIDGIRKSLVVQVLNTLVKDGVNFVSCYAFTEIVNRNVWIKIGK